MKIIVAVCSTRAAEMRLSSASRADWVAKPTMALRLRSVFSQSRMRAAKTGSSSAFQPSSIRTDVGSPSSRSSMRWKRYIMAGVRRRGLSSSAVMSKPRMRELRSSWSSSLSNSQACSPLLTHGSRRDWRSPASGRRRPPSKLLEIAEPAERRIVVETGVHRRGDRSQLFRPFGIEEHAKPVAKEGLVLGRVRQAQRVEAGRLARTKHRIVSAGRPQEDLRAAILVEEDRPRCRTSAPARRGS